MEACLKNKYWICRINLVFIPLNNNNNSNNNDDECERVTRLALKHGTVSQEDENERFKDLNVCI